MLTKRLTAHAGRSVATSTALVASTGSGRLMMPANGPRSGAHRVKSVDSGKSAPPPYAPRRLATATLSRFSAARSSSSGSRSAAVWVVNGTATTSTSCSDREPEGLGVERVVADDEGEPAPGQVDDAELRTEDGGPRVLGAGVQLRLAQDDALGREHQADVGVALRDAGRDVRRVRPAPRPPGPRRSRRGDVRELGEHDEPGTGRERLAQQGRDVVAVRRVDAAVTSSSAPAGRWRPRGASRIGP